MDPKKRSQIHISLYISNFSSKQILVPVKMNLDFLENFIMDPDASGGNGMDLQPRSHLHVHLDK